ncbi:hypothetical protein GCM10022240_26450 [Microbacterium kribbense]|uniref:GGDEF domain-containing protein n=1 Tax=Microbacterium kribbense TaxID=433645 RepID=A0ABP7GSE4_9MICO
MPGHTSVTLGTCADVFEDDLDTVSLALDAARRGSTRAPAAFRLPGALQPGAGLNH